MRQNNTFWEDINEVGTKQQKPQDTINQWNKQFFTKITIGKRKTQIIKIRNEKGDITTHVNETQKIVGA